MYSHMTSAAGTARNKTEWIQLGKDEKRGDVIYFPTRAVFYCFCSDMKIQQNTVTPAWEARPRSPFTIRGNQFSFASPFTVTQLRKHI